ncbi:hypothetical protein Tco_1033293 [Tanacetum coccineum]|uniref:F-box associated beta-propeller type 1 domain-containing protein n=1 Tax=Tanacetum coccineum TaxID=301880 RepID=A0ABQ5GGC3_9ASTR
MAATPFFTQRKESSSEYLRIKERELKLEERKRQEQGEFERLRIAQREKELDLQQKMFEFQQQQKFEKDLKYYNEDHEHLTGRALSTAFNKSNNIFARGDVNSTRVILESLDEFKSVSGLIPSIPKSTAYFCNVIQHVKQAILNIMPFYEGELPVTYLGVPLISSWLLNKDCKILVEKAKNRIGDWKNKSLSFAGRLQLYYPWVCLPRWEGGLGLRNLDVFNIALLTTHIWNIVSNKESLWVRWIHTYKLKGRTIWDIPLQSDLSWGWLKLLQIRDLIRPFLWNSIGNGKNTSIWYDNWCNLSPLFGLLSNRDIIREGFHNKNNVADLISKGWKDRNGTFGAFSVEKDRVRQWDVGSDTDLNLLRFGLCKAQRDSHSHLFFECPFSAKVWLYVRDLAGMDLIPPNLHDIISHLQPMQNKRTARSIFDTYMENLKGELSSVEAENAKLFDEVGNLIKGYLEGEENRISNLERLSSSLEFIQSQEDLATKKADARLECSSMAEHQPDSNGAHGGYKFKILELNSLIGKKRDILKIKKILTTLSEGVKERMNTSESCKFMDANEEICKPRASVGHLGFGYDELSHDYKVVITAIEPKMSTIIYSFKTGKWKEIGHFPCARLFDAGKLLNGVLHWVACKSTSSDSFKIVSLDLANDTYGEILQPEYRKGYNYFKLGVSGEWLCVLHDCYEIWVVDVWVMKVYGVKDSWTKLASISYPRFRWAQTLDPLGPFCISEDGKMLLQFGPQLLVYDSKDGSSWTIDKGCNDACIVVESLASPFQPLGFADNNDDAD